MASELKVDKFTGVTTAGSIDVTSGSVTTNLQQGLIKTRIAFNGTGTIAIRDSVNVTSITDNATGRQTTTYTNAFDVAGDYSVSGIAVDEGSAGGMIAGYYQEVPAVSNFISITTQSASGSAQDSRYVSLNISGDLA